jgi:hypothetical protein
MLTLVVTQWYPTNGHRNFVARKIVRSRSDLTYLCTHQKVSMISQQISSPIERLCRSFSIRTVNARR